MSRIVTHNESTSQLIPSGYTSGGTYTFMWRNPTNAYYNADHSITIEASAIPTIPSFVKKNSQYKAANTIYKKSGSTWQTKTITSVMWMTNGSWTETNDPMSGRTAFKVE